MTWSSDALIVASRRSAISNRRRVVSPTLEYGELQPVAKAFHGPEHLLPALVVSDVVRDYIKSLARHGLPRSVVRIRAKLTLHVTRQETGLHVDQSTHG